mgnify:CR=1 FL=1
MLKKQETATTECEERSDTLEAKNNTLFSQLSDLRYKKQTMSLKLEQATRKYKLVIEDLQNAKDEIKKLAIVIDQQKIETKAEISEVQMNVLKHTNEKKVLKREVESRSLQCEKINEKYSISEKHIKQLTKENQEINNDI